MKFLTYLFISFFNLAAFGADGYLASTNGNIVIGPGGSSGTANALTNSETRNVQLVNGAQIGGTAAPTSGFNVSNSVSAAGSQILTNGNVNVGGALGVGGAISSGAGSINVLSGAKDLQLATSNGKEAISFNGGGTYYMSIGQVDNNTLGIGFSTSQPNGTLQPVLMVGTNKTVVVTNILAATSYGTFVAKTFQAPTNYVASNFTPVSGMGFLVVSNDFLYWVTQSVTNQVAP